MMDAVLECSDSLGVRHGRIPCAQAAGQRLRGQHWAGHKPAWLARPSAWYPRWGSLTVLRGRTSASGQTRLSPGSFFIFMGGRKKPYMSSKSCQSQQHHLGEG